MDGAYQNKSLTGSTELSQATYNEKTKTLTTLALGRGIGDCGQSSVSKLAFDTDTDSAFFKTIEIRSKDVCNGSPGDFPRVFHQR
jgi:hypothetical protein